jgi:hypothetical protein
VGLDLLSSVKANIPFILCTWGELDGQDYRPTPFTERWLVSQVHIPEELRGLLFSMTT